MEHTCAKSVGTPSLFRTFISRSPLSALVFCWEVSDPVLYQPSTLCSSFAKISTLVDRNHFCRSQLFFYVYVQSQESFLVSGGLLNDLETEIRPEFMKVRLLDQSLFFSIFFFTFTVNWRIIALQCVLVSAIQHSESAMSIHISTPSWTSLPPHPWGHHRPVVWAPCVTRQLPSSYFTHGSVYVSVILAQFIPLSPSPALLSTSPFSTSASLLLTWK